MRVAATALAVGVAGEVLLDGHQLGINVLLATAILLVAAAAVAGGVERIDRLDAWIPVTALVLAAFVGLRDDGPLVLLDLVGALGLSVASAPAFAGLSVTRRSATAIVALAARVVAATLVGGFPLAARLRHDVDVRRPSAPATARLLAVARGLLFVVPFLLVFATLFAAADPIFELWLDAALSPDLDPGELPGRVAFTAAVAWLVGGLLWFVLVAHDGPRGDGAAGEVAVPRSLGAAAASDASAPVRIGWIEAATFLIVLDLLFASFVALQLAYLFGGRDSLAAAGMTYATYARRGFFELVAVVVLAGGLLLGLESLVARRPRAYVAAALALVGLTAVVLVSSFVRLRLYQDAYGWTELRFYVLAAMAFLACCLAAAAVLIASGRSRWLPHAVAASSLVVLVLVNLVGPQATITDRNLERVLVPSAVPDYGESRLDAAYLGSFGADAVPALVAALPRLTEAQRERLLPVLAAARERYVDGADPGWQAANLARARAREALEGLFGAEP